MATTNKNITKWANTIIAKPITKREILRETIKGLPSAAKTVLGYPAKLIMDAADVSSGRYRKMQPDLETRKRINAANERTMEELKKKKKVK
jgi:hypothetical protein